MSRLRLREGSASRSRLRGRSDKAFMTLNCAGIALVPSGSASAAQAMVDRQDRGPRCGDPSLIRRRRTLIAAGHGRYGRLLLMALPCVAVSGRAKGGRLAFLLCLLPLFFLGVLLLHPLISLSPHFFEVVGFRITRSPS